MRIAIRADAALKIGVGHVMRCLTFANALTREGAEVHFVCRNHVGHMGESITAAGHTLHLLPPPTEYFSSIPDRTKSPPHVGMLGENWNTDLDQTFAALGEDDFDWMIVDHYGIDKNWESGIRQSFRRIMVIDDLADRLHDADLLLDQNYGRHEKDYSAFVDKNCKILTGSKFALLRPEFPELRSSSISRRKHSELKHILIAFGGMDYENHTGQALKYIRKSDFCRDGRITIVMGEKAPWIDEVKKQSDEMVWPINVKVNVKDMAKLMSDCDLAIGAAGSTSWERCCLGVPTLVNAAAENQWFISSALVNAGAAIAIGGKTGISEKLLNQAIKKCNKKSYLDLMVRNAAMLCDGQGVNLLKSIVSE